MRRALLAILAAGAATVGCTLINGGFDECTTSAQCPADRVCALRPAGGGYCVKPGCNEEFGSTAANAIPLAAALPITIPTPLADGGITYTVDDSEIAGLNAIKLAVQEVNENGGAGTRQFKLLICDTTGDNEVIKQQISYLATKSVPAVITSGSSQTLAASSAAAPSKLLVMTGTGTSPALTSLTPAPDLVWRTAPSDELQATVISNLIKNDSRFTGINTVGIVYVNDTYGVGLEAKLRDKLEIGAPTKVVKSHQLDRSATTADIASVANALHTDNPDLTIVVLFAADASRFIGEARTRDNLKASLGHKWFFADAAKDPTIVSDNNVRLEVNGSYGTAPSQGSGTVFTSFSSRYQTKYGVTATSFSFTAHNYDAFYVLALASAAAVGPTGSGVLDGPAIAAGLGKLSVGNPHQLSPSGYTAAKTAMESGSTIDVQGASGALQFNSSGEAPSPIELWRINTSANPVIEHIEDIDP